MFLVLLSTVVVVLGQEGERKCKPPELEHGDVRVEKGMGDSWTGHFSCKPGYRLSGPNMVKCRDGIGINLLPVCTVTGCDKTKLPSIRNGKRMTVRSMRDSVFRYRCNKGYRLFGPKNVYCTKNGWKMDQVPVCVKPVCNIDQLLGQNVDFGWNNVRPRPMLRGAVYRFSCAGNAQLEGDPIVYCDGIEWSGIKPQCLVPPTAPSLSVEFPWGQMNGSTWDQESGVAELAMGQAISLVCRAQAGNPRPLLSFLLNGEKTEADTANRGQEEDEATLSFVAEMDHQEIEVSCVADNKVAVSPVSSDRLMLNILYPPMAAYIHGPESVISGEQGVMFLEETEWRTVGEQGLKFSCSSDSSNPASWLSVTITDQDTLEEILPSKETTLPKMKLANGFASRLDFYIQLDPRWGREILIECLAYNLQGSSTTNMTVDILYPPGPVEILGDPLLLPNSRPVYTCKSSSPHSSLSWRVEGSGGRLVSDHHVVEGEEDGVAVSVLELDQTDDRLELECTASNMAGHSSDKLVVTPGDPISGVEIHGGPEESEVWSDLHLVCASPLSKLQQDLSWSLTDQLGYSLEFDQEATVVEDGIVYSAIIYQPTKEDVVTAVCTASNPVGYVENSYKTTITKPIILMEPYWLDGFEFDIGDRIEVNCSSPSGIPPDAQIHWYLDREHSGSNEQTYILDISQTTSSLECWVYWEDFTEGASAHFSVNIPTTLPPVETTIYDYVEHLAQGNIREYDYEETTTLGYSNYHDFVGTNTHKNVNAYSNGETTSQDGIGDYEYGETRTSQDYIGEYEYGETRNSQDDIGEYEYGETTTQRDVSDYDYGETTLRGGVDKFGYKGATTWRYFKEYEPEETAEQGDVGEYEYGETATQGDADGYEYEETISTEEEDAYKYEENIPKGDIGEYEYGDISMMSSIGEYEYGETTQGDVSEYEYEETTLQLKENEDEYEEITTQGELGEYEYGETSTQGYVGEYEFGETTTLDNIGDYKYDETTLQGDIGEYEYRETPKQRNVGEYGNEETTAQGYFKEYTNEETTTTGYYKEYENEETTTQIYHKEYEMGEATSQEDVDYNEYKENERNISEESEKYFDPFITKKEMDKYEYEETTTTGNLGEHANFKETTEQNGVGEYEYGETTTKEDVGEYVGEYEYEETTKFVTRMFDPFLSKEENKDSGDNYKENYDLGDYDPYSNKDEEIDAVDSKSFKESTKPANAEEEKNSKHVFDPFVPEEHFLKPENEDEEKSSHIDSTSMAVENLFIPKELASQSKSTYLHQSNSLLILLLVTILYLTHIFNKV